MQPIDTAWNVAKGEASHPSVAGYMSQATPDTGGNIGMRMKRSTADVQNRQFMKLPGSQWDKAHLDRGYPLRRRSEVPMAQHRESITGGSPTIREYVERDTTQNQAHIPMFLRNIENPVGPTGMPDTGGRYPGAFSDLDDRSMRSRPSQLAVQSDMPQMITRSSDSPIDTAWSVLKELSREDLQQAARTGGIGMTDARRQAYGDEGLPLSTGGGFRTMPDTEAQMMMETQRRFRQGHGNLPPGMTDERFARMGMEDARSNQVHDLDEFGDPNFEPMSDSLEPEGRMGFNLAHASLPNPALVEPYDPEPEIDPELSQFQSRTGTAPSNPFERAIHPIEQKRRQKAYEQHLMEQQRQRMAQARRPQMQQSSRARRPGESKNAYRRRMNRR